MLLAETCTLTLSCSLHLPSGHSDSEKHVVRVIGRDNRGKSSRSFSSSAAPGSVLHLQFSANVALTATPCGCGCGYVDRFVCVKMQWQSRNGSDGASSSFDAAPSSAPSAAPCAAPAALRAPMTCDVATIPRPRTRCQSSVADSQGTTLSSPASPVLVLQPKISLHAT